MSISAQGDGLVAGVNAALPPDFVCRLSVEQFHQMLDSGILTEGDPLELLDGWLVPKMMKNPSHSVATELVRKALERVVPEGWFVRPQEPITLATSEPEPDVAVVRGQLRDYLHRHPIASEVALVVEVAGVSLQRDRTLKRRIYAAAGIPLYWIVNLVDGCVEAYSQPSASTTGTEPDYQTRHDFTGTNELALVLDGRPAGSIQAKMLLP